MTTKQQLFKGDFVYLDAPVTSEEIASLGLSAHTMRRLLYLIEGDKQAKLTPREEQELNAFQQAAVFLRLAAQHQH